MKTHPIHSRNEDTACAWLCAKAGRMTSQDEQELAKEIEQLPFRGHPFKLPQINMIERVK